MVNQEDEERIRQVVESELRKLGLDPDHPEKTRDILRWTEKHMASFENVGGWIARSIVLVVVTAIAFAIWEGMKHYLRGLTP